MDLYLWIDIYGLIFMIIYYGFKYLQTIMIYNYGLKLIRYKYKCINTVRIPLNNLFKS
jgi:hypothetical protein